MANKNTSYYKNIKALLAGLRTVAPVSDTFHIHQFKDTPGTWLKETEIFRSDTYAIILLTKGKAHYKIGLSAYDIGDNSLYFMAPQHLRYYHRLSEWEGYVIVFMDDFLADHEPLKDLVHQFEGFATVSRVVVQLDPKQVTQIQPVFQQLHQAAYSDSTFRWQKAKALLELLMVHSKEYYQLQYRDSELKLSKPHRIVRNFDHIIEEHLYELTQERTDHILTISTIAERMNLNPTYLGEVIKKHTGKTPKQILSERISLEAQSFLRNTDLSISEIAYLLKFQDASNFTKFFKAKTGKLPSALRKKR